MALTIPCSKANLMSLGDFIEYVESKIDRKDANSIASAAPMLRAVANDPQLILTALHQQMRETFAQRRLPTTQVVVLGGGSDFYVRADVWPSADAAAKPVYREQAEAYRFGIAQSFPCLMTGHHGPGLIHDLYAYDPGAIIGYVGEPVDLAFIERVQLTTDAAVLFLPQGEVVQRIPPEAYSISVGLMIFRESGEQHYIDVKSRVLLESAPVLPHARRSALLRLAGLIGDENTQQYLDDIAKNNPCARTRLAAYEALVNIMPVQSAALWMRATRDPATAVQRHAQHKLSSLRDD